MGARYDWSWHCTLGSVLAWYLDLHASGRDGSITATGVGVGVHRQWRSQPSPENDIGRTFTIKFLHDQSETPRLAGACGARDLLSPPTGAEMGLLNGRAWSDVTQRHRHASVSA